MYIAYNDFFLGKELLEKRAVLLPTLSSIFIRVYTGEDSPEETTVTVESEDGAIKFTSRWLLKQVRLYLHSHLEFKCVHRKYGTILYPKDADLLTCLSWALRRLQPSEAVTYETVKFLIQ